MRFGWRVFGSIAWIAGCGGGSAPAGDAGDTTAEAESTGDVDGDAVGDDGSTSDAGETDDGVAPVGGRPPGSACSCDGDCAGDVAHPGICVGGICMQRAHANCSAAGSSRECPAGSRCWLFPGRKGPICWPDCASVECAGICDSDGSCAPASESTCEPWCGTYCGTGNSPAGGPCVSDADCEGGATCYPDWYGSEPTGFIGGYCMLSNCTATSCPAGSACIRVDTSGAMACMRSCAGDADCREGYACSSDTNTCWPACEGGDCPSGYECYGDPGEDYCTGGGAICSTANPTGWCPEGWWCDDGVCSDDPFTCDPDSREPNDSAIGAVPLPPDPEDLTICSGDEDWFRFALAAETLGIVRISLPHALSDLDLVGLTGAGAVLGARGEGGYPYSSSYRVYETGEEALAFVNVAGPETEFLARILGYASAVGPYALTYAETRWVDGDSCTRAGFHDCDGRSRGSLALIEFPFPDPDDGYVGARYAFDSVSNYRWGRRELIMAVRYAIHETNERYAFDLPLGIIDICQSDGITPGYDIDDPRHPATTHDQGGNADIAYFQTTPDNRARIICGDGSTHADGYCSPAAATRHTVDLTRQAYFMAKLNEWGGGTRLRVIGVDRVIGPLLADELRSLAADGVITNALSDQTIARMAYGDGWPYHHHHVHVSFRWWGTKSATAGADLEMAAPGAPPVRGSSPRPAAELHRRGCAPLGCER